MVNFSGYWNSKFGLLYFQYCSYAETCLLIEKNLFTRQERKMFRKRQDKEMGGCSYGIYEEQESFDSFIERMTGLYGNDEEGMKYHFETHYQNLPIVLAQEEEEEKEKEEKIKEKEEYLKTHPGHYWIENCFRTVKTKEDGWKKELRKRYVYYTDGKRIASRVAWTGFFEPEFMREYDFVGRRECRFYGSPEFLASIRKKFETGMFDDLRIQSVKYGDEIDCDF